MQDHRRLHLLLKDGRRLCYAVFGSLQPRRTMLYFHGYMSSRLEAELLENQANRLKVRLLAFDRAGYGGSSADPHRTPENSAEDAEQLLNAVLPPEEKVTILAASGGAPYGAAYAAAFPERCISMGLLVPYALPTGQDEELVAAMAPASRKIVEDALRRPGKTKCTLHLVRIVQRIPHGKLLLRLAGFSEIDLAAVDDFRAKAAMLKMAAIEGTRPGIAGAFRDLQIMASVALADICSSVTCKTVIWAGMEDRTCPPAMARLYQRLIPPAEGHLHIVNGSGHFLGFQYDEDILNSLL